MNVFLTGGTGFVGREVLRQLVVAGHQVRLLVRNAQTPVARQLASEPGIELWPGDLSEAGPLVRALHGTDAVIHLVGIISEFGRQSFENVHVRATQNLVGAAQAAGVKRFVHMSALGTRPHSVSRYHQTKWIAEQAVSQSSLDWTIFRPSLIYGPGDRFVNLFARLAQWSPVLPVLGPGRALLQPVAVEDVARCFVGALGEPRSIRQTLDVCGPAQLTLPQILEVIGSVTGRKRWIVRVPLELAAALAAVLECICPRLGQAPPLNRDQLQMLQEDNVGEPGWTVEMFELSQMPFAEGIARHLKPMA